MKRAVLLAIFLVLIIGCSQPASDLQTTGGLTVSPSAIPEGVVGRPYSVKISVQNSKALIKEVGIANGTLPEGLEFKKTGISTEIAEISGTPQKSGKFGFTIFVTCIGVQDTAEGASQQYNILIKEK
jgi:hypothetical protein